MPNAERECQSVWDIPDTVELKAVQITMPARLYHTVSGE